MPLTIESRPVAELVVDPTNARHHSPRNIDAIRASLRHFGQRKPLVIDQHGVVIAGNGTLEAMRAEGWTDAEVTVFPGTPAEARAYALTDNRTAELAAWDETNLADVLRMIDDDIRGDLGWDDDEIEKILNPYTDDADTSPQMGELQYRIIIECRDEAQQADLLRRLEDEGLEVRAVMT